jgi:fatty acid desaturase
VAVSRRPGPADLAIPGRLNIALAVAAYAAAAGCLWLASRGGPRAVVAAVAFSYVGNTVFSLLHESVHGIFHPTRGVNEGFGRVSAALFPTGLTFQRVCHLGHHRRNRTDAELYDYYRPGQSRFWAWYRLYGLLLGFYWLAIPVGCLLYLALGRWATAPALRRVARPIGLEARLEDLEAAPVARTRAEILFTLAVQAALCRGLGVTPAGWALCYGAFALNWCALQYTDHAWTPRDIRHGASNLRVGRVVQYVFLNYHHHLAHHRYPRVPWLHLPRFVDWNAPRPGFLRTYLSLWRGPRPTREPAPGRIEPELERDLERAAFPGPALAAERPGS